MMRWGGGGGMLKGIGRGLFSLLLWKRRSRSSGSSSTLDNAPKMGDNEIIKLFIICAHISSSSLFPLSLSSSSSSRDSQWQCSSASSTARYVFFSFLSFFSILSYSFVVLHIHVNLAFKCVCEFVCVFPFSLIFCFLSFLKWRVVTSVKVALKSGCATVESDARTLSLCLIS